MAEAYIISVDTIKANSLINDNVDNNLLKSSLIAMQDLYLQDILGTPLFEDIKLAIDGDPDLILPVNANYKSLIQEHIKKVLIYYVMWDVIDPLRFRMMNKGIMVKDGETSKNADYTEARVFKDNLRIKAEKYAEKLTKYLKDNTSTFPKYLESTTSGNTPNSSNFSTGIDLLD